MRTDIRAPADSSKILHKYVAPIVLVAVLGMQGCAAHREGAQNTSLPNVKSALMNGEIRLVCNVACAMASGMHAKEMNVLYSNHLWEDLAFLVAKVGYADDLAYFYLGRAAESLGSADAALTYFRLANTVHRCAGLVNNCSGIDVSAEVKTKIALISNANVRTMATEKPESVSINDQSSAKKSEPQAAVSATKIAPTDDAVSTPAGNAALGQVRVFTSEFESVVALIGEKNRVAEDKWASQTEWLLTSGFEKKNPSANIYQLVVEDTYVHTRPKRWKSASTNKAQELEVTRTDLVYLNRWSDEVRIKETFNVVLPVAVVEDGIRQETKIQINGVGGQTMILTISPARMASIFEAQKAANRKSW